MSNTQIVAQKNAQNPGVLGNFKTPDAVKSFFSTHYFQEQNRYLLVASSHEHDQNWIVELIKRCRKKKNITREELVNLHKNKLQHNQNESSIILLIEENKIISSSYGSELSVKVFTIPLYQTGSEISRPKISYSTKKYSPDGIEEQSQSSHELYPQETLFISILIGTIPQEVHTTLSEATLSSWNTNQLSLLSLSKKEKNLLNALIKNIGEKFFAIIKEEIVKNQAEFSLVTGEFSYHYIILASNNFYIKN